MEEEISQETNAGKSKKLERLLGIMRQLRDPESGCQWDLQQTFSSLIKYTIEEAYEVSDAVIRGNTPDIIEELGDLLLQVVFFSQIADEGNLFKFDDVVEAINEKLIRRHPHIFSKDKAFKTADEQKESWSELKKLENRKNPIQIAFIGCGKFVSMFLSQYSHLEKIEINSIVDLNIEQAKKNCHSLKT